jgi:AcrR family transcriptional regulator
VAEPAIGSRHRTRLTGEQRRENFLDIAAEIIVEQGLEGLTMEGLAARAGVSKALGYRYFENRDALLVAVLQRESSRYDTRVATALQGASTFEDRARAMVDVFLDAVAERGALFTVLTQARLSDDSAFEAERKRRNRQVEEYMARLLQAESGVDDESALIASSIFLMGALGLIIAWVERDLPRERVVDTFVKMAKGALDALRDDSHLAR